MELMAGNIVYILFDHVQVRTKKGKKKTIVQENAVHAVAEEFLDLRLGHHFFKNHWIFLVGKGENCYVVPRVAEARSGSL